MKSTWAFPDSPETPVVTSRGVYVRSLKSRATADLSALLFFEARGAKKSRLRRVSRSGVRDARHAFGIGNVFLADMNEIPQSVTSDLRRAKKIASIFLVVVGRSVVP